MSAWPQKACKALAGHHFSSSSLLLILKPPVREGGAGLGGQCWLSQDCLVSDPSWEFKTVVIYFLEELGSAKVLSGSQSRCHFLSDLEIDREPRNVESVLSQSCIDRQEKGIISSSRHPCGWMVQRRLYV